MENWCFTAVDALYGPFQDAALGHPSWQYYTLSLAGKWIRSFVVRGSPADALSWLVAADSLRSTNACTSDSSSSPAIILDTDRLLADVRFFPSMYEMD